MKLIKVNSRLREVQGIDGYLVGHITKERCLGYWTFKPTNILLTSNTLTELAQILEDVNKVMKDEYRES